MMSSVGRLRDGHRQPVIVALGVTITERRLSAELLFVDSNVRPGPYELVGDEGSVVIRLDERYQRPAPCVYENEVIAVENHHAGRADRCGAAAAC